MQRKEPFICPHNLKIHLGIRATRALLFLALIARCILRLEVEMKWPNDHCLMIIYQTYINCCSILESSSTFPLSIILTISKPLYTLLFTSALARLPLSFTRKTPEERWLLRCLVYYWVLQKLCKIFLDQKLIFLLIIMKDLKNLFLLSYLKMPKFRMRNRFLFRRTNR